MMLTGRPRVIGSSVSPRRERVGVPSLIGICRPPGGLPSSSALSTAIDTSALRERSRKPVRERTFSPACRASTLTWWLLSLRCQLGEKPSW